MEVGKKVKKSPFYIGAYGSVNVNRYKNLTNGLGNINRYIYLRFSRY